MKKILYKLLISLIVLLISPAVAVADPIVMTQTGGYHGKYHLAVGTDWDWGEATIGIGYTPESAAGEDLYQGGLKLLMKPVTMKRRSWSSEPYFGVSVLYMEDEDTFSRLPSQYPKRYYPPTAIRTAGVLGMSIGYGPSHLFFEITSLDTFMEAKVRNPGHLTWEEMGTYAVGYKWSTK